MSRVSLPDLPLPVEYQQADIRYVFSTLMAGECCSLLGVGSVGKSNLLRHMLRHDVRQFHLTKEGASFLIPVLLDPHNMIRLEGEALNHAGPIWSGYELMLSRLYRAAEDHLLNYTIKGLDEVNRTALLEKISDKNWHMFSSETLMAQSGLRHLEYNILNLLKLDDRLRIAFLFDELDEFRHLCAEFFMSLRGLRDEFKGRIMYVVTSRNDLYDLMMMTQHSTESREILESFVELFHEHTFYLHPLDIDSARAVMKRFFHRYQHSHQLNRHEEEEYVENFMRSLFELTGRHVGLLRRAFKPAIEYFNQPSEIPLHDYLLRNKGIRKEFNAIVNSLSNQEKALFRQVLLTGEINDVDIWQRLVEKHLVSYSDDGKAYWLPLLGHYAQTNPEAFVDPNYL